MYAIYNPITGENEMVGKKNDAIKRFWEITLEFVKRHMHGNTYMIVEIDATGAETWKNSNNVEIEKPKSISEIKQLISIPTKVETLP